MPQLNKIDVAGARKLLESGQVVIVDVREADEHRREWISGAANLPLSRLTPDEPVPARGKALIFHCKSGLRTMANEATLAQLAANCGAADGYILEGGLEAWRTAGQPIIIDRRQPLELQRQVQITAGSLVVLGVVAALVIHPGFLGLAAFVGAGLVFAGVTGTCGMARLLAIMPWNRPRAV